MIFQYHWLFILLLFVTPIAGAEEPWVDPREVAPQEAPRKPLTVDQTLEITRIQQTFAEVDMLPLEEWLEMFRREESADREITVWRRIAAVYTEYLKGRRVKPDYKKEVFKLLVACSAMPREDVPQNTALKLLSAKETIEIMDLFYGVK